MHLVATNPGIVLYQAGKNTFPFPAASESRPIFVVAQPQRSVKRQTCSYGHLSMIANQLSWQDHPVNMKCSRVSIREDKTLTVDALHLTWEG